VTPDAMRAVAERHVAAENAGDVGGAVATYADDCFYENVALGIRFAGKSAVGAQYAALFAAVPDGRLRLEGEAFGPDVLVHWGTFEGTVTGEFFGLAPTGRRLALPFVAILFFADGRMRGERLVYDLATLSEQAGFPLDAVQASARMLAAALGAAA